MISPAIQYAKFQPVTHSRTGVPAAASRNQFFRRLCHAPQPSHGYRRQAATAGGSVRVGPLGLSVLVWSELAAVRGVVGRVVATRRGRHPGPPSPEHELAYWIAGLIAAAEKCFRRDVYPTRLQGTVAVEALGCYYQALSYSGGRLAPCSPVLHLQAEGHNEHHQP